MQIYIIHVYISIPFFLTHLLNFGHSHLDAVYTLPGLLSCSVRKIIWFHVHYSYCTICMCCYLCVCELQRGDSIFVLWLAQAQKSYPNPRPWPPKLILQHNLDAVTFDTTQYTEHTARPSNSTRQSHLFRRSCHGLRICRRRTSARKSIVSSLSLSFPD